MTNITEAINLASKALEASGIPNHRKEAGSLLSIALERDRTFLIAHNEYELGEAEKEVFHELVARRSKREPFQHLSGKQEFYGLDFTVSPDVLIPRPETELIVEAGIRFLREKGNPRFCEIGLGSGCISVSILKSSEHAEAVACDISKSALKIAKENAKSHGVEERLEIVRSDLFDELEKEEFDLIVANPPYIPGVDFETLQPEVRNFDPRIALTDEKDGLSIIEQIASDSPKWLKMEGLLLLEIGIDQSESVKKFFNVGFWESLDFVDDFQGIPRMVRAQRL